MRQCKVIPVNAVCAHYTLHTYVVLHLLCNRFIFSLLCSWRFNFFHVLIGIIIIDGIQHQLYNPGYVVFVNPWRRGCFVAGGLRKESLLRLFLALLAGLLMASCEVVTDCWWEVAVVTALVQDDLLGSFLVADLLFWRLIVSNNLFYYQHVALGYAYCCACIILIFACALFLQLLLPVIDPFSFGLLRVCMSVTLTTYV